MLESKAKIIPVFYQVDPWELRHIERGQYADAFSKYEEKGRYLEKLSDWKEALQFLSFIAGEEFNSSSECQKIVAAVQKEVQRKQCLIVAKYPCGLEERRHKPKAVGIFGMIGVGKTTLAKELFNRKR
ncbi:hypothetical protein SUGI_0094840 [Cryptomeria japonica]|nr:hypothetical protein SUGI_0094840 [Cryptomeria japonica]